MRSAKSTGRIIGVLLVQLAGLTVPFILMLPLTRGTSEFLTNAAGISFQIKVAVFLLFANCLLRRNNVDQAWREVADGGWADYYGCSEKIGVITDGERALRGLTEYLNEDKMRRLI